MTALDLTRGTSPVLAAKHGDSVRYTANPPTRRAEAHHGTVASKWDAGPAADWCEVPGSWGETALAAPVEAAAASLGAGAGRRARQAAVHAATPCTRPAPHWPTTKESE